MGLSGVFRRRRRSGGAGGGRRADFSGRLGRGKHLRHHRRVLLP